MYSNDDWRFLIPIFGLLLIGGLIGGLIGLLLGV